MSKTKRILSLLLCLVMVLGMLPVSALAADETEKIEISTSEDLNAIRNNLSGYYILTDDIDLSDWGSWTPIGDESAPFTGTLDGDGYTISNLKIDMDEETDEAGTTRYAGLFGRVEGGTIGNLGLSNADISFAYDGKESSSYIDVGGIAAYIENGAINCCFFTGTIEATVVNDAFVRAAGIVGVAVNSKINDCFSNAAISASAEYMNTMVAGITCWPDGVTVSNCYVAGSVSGKNTNSYCYVGGINASGHVDSIYGYIYNYYGTIENCVVLLDSIIAEGAGVYKDNIGKFSEQENCKVLDPNSSAASSQSTYENLGWDFDVTWYLDTDENKFPLLIPFLISRTREDWDLIHVELSSRKISDSHQINNSDGTMQVVEKYEYEIIAEISNGEDVTAPNVMVILDIPEQLTISDETPVVHQLGDLSQGETKTVSWTVYADWPEQSAAVYYDVTVNMNDSVGIQQEDYIYLIARNEHDNSIIFGVDQWNFVNSGDYFTDGEAILEQDEDGNSVFKGYKEKYYITDEEFSALTADISNIEFDLIKWKRNDNWSGSCYGMSVIVALTKLGIIEPTQIQDGKNTLYSIEKYNNDAVESYINFYHFQQWMIPCLENKEAFVEKSTQEQLEIIESMVQGVATGSNPVLLGVSVKGGGHRVVAYGIEYGQFRKFGLFTFDSRILIYDPNYSESPRYLYFNHGTDEWWSPTYTKLTDALNQVELIDYVNHKTAVANSRARLIARDNFEFYLKYLDNTYSIDESTDDHENGLFTYWDDNVLADGTFASSQMTLMLPNLSDNYSVQPTTGNPCDYSLWYENVMISAAGESIENIDFGADGEVDAQGVTGDYSISLVYNDGYHTLPWYAASVSGTSSIESDISMRQTDEGIIISGDNLDNVEVSVRNKEESMELSFSTDKDSVLLTKETINNRDNPIILIDEDSDGVYETPIARIPVYTITFDANGGTTSTASDVTNEDGTLASLPIPTRDGYTFTGWYTDPTDGEQITTETVFTSDTTVYAHWTKNPELPTPPVTPVLPVTPEQPNNTPETPDAEVKPPFADVPDDAYYLDAVLWAEENEITSGVDGKHFAPNLGCTRAQAVTFLWRAVGSPAPQNSAMPFKDVLPGAYCYDAVLWAVENNITVGTSESTFSPEATCTRAQIVTFLYRAQGTPEVNSVNPFTDVADNAYYMDAVLWAVEKGITNGTGKNYFSPDDICTRAQIITFLYRFFN